VNQTVTVSVGTPIAFMGHKMSLYVPTYGRTISPVVVPVLNPDLWTTFRCIAMNRPEFAGDS